MYTKSLSKKSETMCTGRIESIQLFSFTDKGKQAPSILSLTKTHQEKIYSKEYFIGYQYKPGNQSDFSNCNSEFCF